MAMHADAENAGEAVADATSRETSDSHAKSDGSREFGWLIFSDYYTTRDQFWAVIGGIGCGAVLGVLTRDRLVLWFAAAIAEPGAAGRAGVVIAHIIPNIVGCFVMGTAVALRPRLQPPHPTIYAGLTTGFCGCCTTFSSYNTAVAMLFLRSADAGEGLLCAALAIFLGAATAWLSLMLGLILPPQPKLPIAERAQAAHRKLSSLLAAPGKKEDDIKAVVSDLMAVADELDLAAPRLKCEVPQLPGKFIRLKMLVYWSLLVIALAIVVTLVSVDIEHLSPLLVAATVAPLGAWLRYGLGLWNGNYRLPYFTLFANLTAATLSALLAYILDKSCGSHSVESTRWIAVSKGVSTGFCGSLSTVSSFVDEVRRLGELDKRRALLYVIMTLLGGQTLALLILAPAYASTDGCALWKT